MDQLTSIGGLCRGAGSWCSHWRRKKAQVDTFCIYWFYLKANINTYTYPAEAFAMPLSLSREGLAITMDLRHWGT